MSPHERSRPLNGAGRASSGQLNPADPGQARAESQPTGPPGADTQGGRLRAVVSHPALRHLVLLAVYLGAGIAATWPLAAYLVQSRLPRTRDVASYVWDLWWIAHQVVHLGNPWFTDHMAAPVGIQLGFNTTMPLVGLVMTPVTLAFGPSAAYSLLTIVTARAAVLRDVPGRPAVADTRPARSPPGRSSACPRCWPGRTGTTSTSRSAACSCR